MVLVIIAEVILIIIFILNDCEERAIMNEPLTTEQLRFLLDAAIGLGLDKHKIYFISPDGVYYPITKVQCALNDEVLELYAEK